MFSSGVVARGAGDFDWRGDRARDQRSGFRCRACRTRHSRFPAKKLRVARLRNQRNLWLHCLYGCVLAFWGGNPTPDDFGRVRHRLCDVVSGRHKSLLSKYLSGLAADSPTDPVVVRQEGRGEWRVRPWASRRRRDGAAEGRRCGGGEPSRPRVAFTRHSVLDLTLRLTVENRCVDSSLS
jgi:hypothetical protein